MVGKTAASVQSNTTGDFTSTSTDYATLQFDADGDGTAETWYYSNGTPDYNYHTDNVSYSGGRSFSSLWWQRWILDSVFWYPTLEDSWTPNRASARGFLKTYKTYSNIMWNTYYFPYADPTREHYTFAGWYTAPTGGTKITEGTTCSQNTTLYAHWTPNEYIVEFEYPYGEYYSETVTAGQTYQMPAGVYDGEYYYHTGYHIAYWESASGTIYDPGYSYSVIVMAEEGWAYYDGDSICLAAYEEPNSYTLEFNANGGTGTIASQTRTYGETVTLPSSGFSKTGYTFSGWKNEFGTSFSAGQTYSVADLAGLEVNTNGATITLYAQWTINTYTLSFSNGYYYSSSGYSVSLTAPGCTITNATLTKSNPTSTVSHTYSTTAVTVSLTRNDSHLWLYVDGVCVNVGDNSISWSWSPTASHTATWYIREIHNVSSNTSEGIASATYSRNSNSHTGASNPSNATSMEILEGTIVDFKATLKNGYVFDGWYNGSTRVSTSATYTGITISSNLTLTAKAKKVYDKVKYDSSGKYHYFEDGNYPQTYVGDSLNSTLNSWYSGKSITYTMFVNNTLTDCYTYNGTKYARVKCPKSYTVTLKSGASKAFSANSYYWFKIEPIRWRVSNYGVSDSYYSDTLYSRFVNAGSVNAVSELVLDFQPLAFDLESVGKVLEGWDYLDDGAVAYAQLINYSYADMITEATKTKSFDYFNNTGSNKKVLQRQKEVSWFHQASISDITNAGITDYRAKGSDLACMLMGVSSASYCNYSTRDLFDLSSGKYVTTDGTVRHWWLNKACGIRLAYSSTGKSA
ncbi:MAG: InlB B-repeat-containing protein [Clostridia bacterium]|nr:InlB B-repeat-containing protein [Clostridia bacterium]